MIIERSKVGPYNYRIKFIGVLIIIFGYVGGYLFDLVFIYFINSSIGDGSDDLSITYSFGSIIFYLIIVLMISALNNIGLNFFTMRYKKVIKMDKKRVNILLIIVLLIFIIVVWRLMDAILNIRSELDSGVYQASNISYLLIILISIFTTYLFQYVSKKNSQKIKGL